MKALGGFWQWCRERKCDGKHMGMKEIDTGNEVDPGTLNQVSLGFNHVHV